LILLCSGATVTYAHHAITAGAKLDAVWGLFLTIILAIIFTGFQVFEYVSADFHISDGIFGSTFFMATGFHGAHVAPICVCFYNVLVTKSYWEFTQIIFHKATSSPQIEMISEDSSMLVTDQPEAIMKSYESCLALHVYDLSIYLQLPGRAIECSP
jgi:hypothetical protein